MMHLALNNVGDPVPITVTAPRSVGGTTLSVSSLPANFPTSFPPYVYLTAFRGSVPLAVFEVVGRSGNTLTLTAGAVDGTTDVALIVGDFVKACDNAGLWTELQAIGLPQLQ